MSRPYLLDGRLFCSTCNLPYTLIKSRYKTNWKCRLLGCRSPAALLATTNYLQLLTRWEYITKSPIRNRLRNNLSLKTFPLPVLVEFVESQSRVAKDRKVAIERKDSVPRAHTLEVPSTSEILPPEVSPTTMVSTEVKKAGKVETEPLWNHFIVSTKVKQEPDN